MAPSDSENKSNESSTRKTSSSVVIGDRIAHYTIISKIGSGGMGEVWLAQDDKLNRKVALKFPSAEFYAGVESQEQLLREARAAAALQHPNVVTIYEVGVANGRPFLAMAYIEGPTLKELSTKRRTPIEMAIKFGIQISAGLAGAHERGITHRDLKPGNLMVDKSHNLHILDFGLALTQKTRDDGVENSDLDETVTRIVSGNTLAGTLNYMAPEQLTGGEVGPLVDVFALGVILYELVYGSHPFKGESPADLLKNILRDTPPEFPADRDDIPYDLIRIVGRCLQKDPEYRFQTAKDVRNELLDLQELISKGADIADLSLVASAKQSFLKEERFILTTDMVRALEFQSPKMIGDHLAYLDNGVVSDTLVIYLPAWGLDHRHGADFLKALPCRGIAPTLYGFEQRSKNRFPLTLEDHSKLLIELFGELSERINPERVILSGFSSGADHAMHIATSETYPGINITGVVSFGCNTSLRSCFLSSQFAQLKQSSAEVLLDEMKKIGDSASSLTDWLKFHEYMVTIFSKFGINADPLRALGKDIIKPFQDRGWRQFADWYQIITKKYAYSRFVVDADDFESLDEIMGYHLKENVLGENYRDDSVIRESVPHVELAHPEILLKHTLAIIEQMETA